MSPIAAVSPARAAETVQRAAGYGTTPLDATPRLFYFYDSPGSRWRLVYVIEDVAKPARAAAAGAETPAEGDSRAALIGMPEYSDYVVDANTADLVAELPRTHNAGLLWRRRPRRRAGIRSHPGAWHRWRQPDARSDPQHPDARFQVPELDEHRSRFNRCPAHSSTTRPLPGARPPSARTATRPSSRASSRTC